MLELALAAALWGQALMTPTFTDAEVRAALVCADGPEPGRCAPPVQAAMAGRCMTDLPAAAGRTEFLDCMGGVTSACAKSWAATESAMNRRVILVCSAGARAAVRGAIDAWTVRAATQASPQRMAAYRRLLDSVPGRVAAEIADVPDSDPNAEILRAGATEGVWASLAHFLWEEERAGFSR